MGKTQKNDSQESEKKSPKRTKKSAFYVTARRNTRLADGTFVAEGEKVKVTAEFVERLRAENDESFEITKE